jgi:WXG100 family type VII secretion target
MDIAVNSEVLRRQSSSVTVAAGDIGHDIQSITGQVQNLTADWRGASSDAFQNMWHEWQQGAHQLLTAMEGIGHYLEQAAQTFEDAEQSVTNGMNR